MSSPGPGPWYLLRREKVGVESCPVHGEGEVARARKVKVIRMIRI